MTGWIAWAKSKVAAVVETASHVIKKAKYAARTIYYTPQYWDPIKNNLMQFWQGFSRVLQPSIVSRIAKLNKTKRVLTHSLTANLVYYMGLVLVYEMGVKAAMRSVPYMQDSPAEYAIDTLAKIYLMRTAVSMCVDNTLYNSSLYAAVNSDLAEQERLQLADHITARKRAGKQPFKSWECSDIETAKAAIMSPFYSSAKMIFTKLASHSLPAGDWLTLPIKALVYGENLLEYKLASVGTCTNHRHELFRKNHMFSFGMGLSMLGMIELLSVVVRRATGVESAFVYDALFNIVFQHYMILAATMTKPLPGEQEGVDVFKYSRSATRRLLTDTAINIANYVQNPDNETDWFKAVKNIYGNQAVKLITRTATNILIEKDLQSMRSFVRRPAALLYLDLNGQHIQNTLNMIVEKRNTLKSSKWFMSLYPYLPGFILSDTIKQAIDVAASEKLDGVLESVNQFIEKNGISQLQPKILIYFDEKIQQAIIIDNYMSNEPKRAQIEVLPDQSLPALPSVESKPAPSSIPANAAVSIPAPPPQPVVEVEQKIIQDESDDSDLDGWSDLKTTKAVFEKNQKIDEDDFFVVPTEKEARLQRLFGTKSAPAINGAPLTASKAKEMQKVLPPPTQR